MNSDPGLDYDSLQAFLANVFLVQESGIDARSLAAFVKIQRSIANGNCGVEETMDLVADHAREVANATGVAIALLEADQLVCQAGSGSAAGEIGRHVTAVLSATANNVRKEILRVENAQADSRIEAEICRQFGGTSLLMLPIYRKHAVAGVVRVIFDTEHAFQEREVRAYRLLAGLVEEAMDRAERASKLEEKLREVVPQAVEQIASQEQLLQDDEESAPAVCTEPWVRQACAAAGGGSPVAGASAKAAPAAAAPERSAFLSEVWRKGTAAAAVGALVMIGWTAYMEHRATFAGSTVTENANTVAPPLLSSVSKPLATVPAGTQSATRLAPEPGLPGFTRKRISASEIDYVADDVTMRVFIARRNAAPVERWTRQVKYGNDVTVRYFSNEPAQPGSSDRPSAVSK